MKNSSTVSTALAQTALSPERTASLFEPVRINKVTLKNRIVMPPMTRTMSPDGIPTADSATYYRHRAEGGVGLVIGEGTWVPHPDRGDFDLVAVGRGLLMNADWAKHVRAGRLDALKPWDRDVLTSLT